MRNNTWKIGVVLGLLVLIFCLLSNDLQAQCPMCRMSAESNLKNGGTDGRGLNTGILYMLAMPYMLVAAIGFWWYRNRRSNAGGTDLPELLEEDSNRFN